MQVNGVDQKTKDKNEFIFRWHVFSLYNRIKKWITT
jgi:hypothetical protein